MYAFYVPVILTVATSLLSRPASSNRTLSFVSSASLAAITQPEVPLLESRQCWKYQRNPGTHYSYTIISYSLNEVAILRFDENIRKITTAVSPAVTEDLQVFISRCASSPGIIPDRYCRMVLPKTSFSKCPQLLAIHYPIWIILILGMVCSGSENECGPSFTIPKLLLKACIMNHAV